MQLAASLASVLLPTEPHDKQELTKLVCLSCRKGLRTDTSIVIETAQCNSTHHVCMLIGYGAHAISPYMAFETCRQWRMAPR